MSEKKPQHNPNLWKQVGELNQAEKRVLHAFREGWKADDWQKEVAVSSAIPENSAEKQIKNHWQGAILRARVLRDLFLGNYGEFDSRHITISLAWIEGALELDYCESKFPIAFSKCVFPDGISLQHATIPLLSLQGCEVGQFQDMHAPMLIGQSVFLQQAKVNTNVFLNGGFKADGEVTLTGAEIGGQLACNGGHFQSSLMAYGLKVGNDVLLCDGFQVYGEVFFVGANIGGGLECHGGYLKNGLVAEGLRSKNIFLRDGFKVDGKVNLNGANIGEQLDCSGGCFEEGLNAQGLKTGSNVYLRNGFKANGEVSLLGADIGKQLVCRGGHFEKDLIAQGLKTGDNAVFDNGFKISGWITLFGAEIGGVLSCGGGYFAHDIHAKNLVVKQNLILDGAEINGGIVLDSANVGGSFQNLSTWPRTKICSADGFRYREIKNGDDSNRELGKGIAWLGQTQVDGFRPQPYEQLMAVYRRMGHANWAREVGFALEKRRSKEFKGRWRCHWRAWYFILRCTIGFGYRPFIALRWALALLVLGTFLFSNGHSHSVFKIPPASFINNEWIPSEGEALASARWEKDRKPPLDYIPFSPFVYSLEAAFPVLSLGQLEKWHPKNHFLLVMRWIWTFIGSSLLAILALFGVGVLGPRWRGGDEDG